jgi:polyisoprenoid-binding protein YceI
VSDAGGELQALTDSSGSGPGAKRLRVLWVIAGMALIALLGFGVHVWTQVKPILSPKYKQVDYTVPAAPRLVAVHGETVYRIDPTHSQAAYGVDEKIAGATADHAIGVTNGIAGDIAVNPSDPAASRVGEIVIDLQQLHSGNNLRDARLRAAYLGSHDYPLARFTATTLSGMPVHLGDGQQYHFQMAGDLTIKTKTAPVVWDVTGQTANGKLTAQATTMIKQSSFGIGPISIAGFLSTSNNVKLTLTLVALNPSKYSVPTEISAPPGTKPVGVSPSFKAAIMPVLQESCASCHNPGQVGAAHWQLRTAEDAASVADGLRVVTQARFMPPWPASSLGVPLAHNKSLDQKTIDLIARWAKAGGKLDVPATTPITASADVLALRPRPDLVLRMPAAYLGSLDNPNDYRCFVLDPHFTQPTYLTGYSFTPEVVTEIHHSQIFHVGADRAADNEALSGKDGKPGWQCYGGPEVGRVDDLNGFTGEPGLIAGWAPGQDPVVYPDHSGVLMQPGDVLVLQIHYHYDQTPLPDQSSLSLQIEPGTASVHRIDIINPLAPVEIPCMPGDVAPLCNRQAALANAFHEYGVTGLAEQGLLPICGQTAQGLTQGFNGVAHSSCTMPVPESGQLITVFGHMHTLGKSVRLILDPGTPQQQVLLDIPNWNFDWQMNYALATPIHVTPNDRVEMDCTWDRSIDPNRPPKYLVFAEGTEDEMCFGTYAIIPDGTS